MNSNFDTEVALHGSKL